MNIKVCGITQLKQLQQLDGLDIDFAGLIFYPGSPRYMGDKLSSTDLQHSDFDLKKVGVFVNADYEEIASRIDEYSLDVVQLHGQETSALCESLSDHAEVIKAFRLGVENIPVDEIIADFDEVCDYYLFDTSTADGIPGGTGKKFDWDQLGKAKIEKPFFLSGGIGPDDVAKINAFRHPDLYAVDINSKFEKEPGIKDMALILQFRQGLKK